MLAPGGGPYTPQKSNVVDIETGDEIPTPPPVRDEVIHAMLEDLMRKNECGHISALICVMLDDLGDTSYDISYPANMPPAVYIGALEITKNEILRTVRSMAPVKNGGA